MELNNENYFSKEANIEYMSVSQYKNFLECPAMALALINEEYIPETKESYLEGKLFENIVTGNETLFMSKHPEMISSKGATAGQLKSNFKSVKNAADKFSAELKKRGDYKDKMALISEHNAETKEKVIDAVGKTIQGVTSVMNMNNGKQQDQKKQKKYIPANYTKRMKEIIKKNRKRIAALAKRGH